MKYKHFYIGVAFRIILIVLLSIASAYLYFVQNQLIWSILVLILVFLASLNLIRYFNRLNRWISFFLSGIENEDTSLKIPSHSGNKSIDEVLRGIQRINSMLKKNKIDIASKEQYFKTIINQSATGLFSVNENGRIIHINPVASQLTGLQEHHHINSLKKIDSTLPGFILHNQQKTKVFENKKGLKLQFRSSQIINKKEKIILIAVSNITKELNNQEVEAWIKLARTLSHEIMNNITPITTLSQVISGYFKKNKDVKSPDELSPATIKNAVKGLEVIEERSESLLHFVQHYRKFTKLPKPVIAPVNISNIVENCLVAISAYPGFNRIKLEKNIPGNIFIETDEKLISQTLINIFKNAYEAVIDNKKEAVIKVKITGNHSPVKIEIANNGQPISESLKEQIFVPFFSTKKEGSGIGLSLSKQILLQMNGDIVLKPYRDEFTRFEITLRN